MNEILSGLIVGVMEKLPLVAVGSFLFTWLVSPLLFKRWTFKDGFAIGIIAALVMLCFYGLLYSLLSLFW